MKPKFYTLWRSISVVLIGLMFIGPWHLRHSSFLFYNPQPVCGWQVIWNNFFYIFSGSFFYQIPSKYWVELIIPDIMIAFGGICTTAYAIVSIVLLISKNKTVLYRYARLLLICSSLILIYALEFLIGWRVVQLWGYWVGIAGLFSSYFLEWSIRKSRLSDAS